MPYGDNGDGKVTYNYATDQFRRYLEFVHKLYAEGLINPEIFTMDAATINAQVKAGQCFFLGNVGTQLTGVALRERRSGNEDPAPAGVRMDG